MNKETINENWWRLETVIKYTGMSINKFAKEIGLPVAENLYRIKRGQNGISRNMVNLITDRFPEINRCWLICGEAPMVLKSDPAQNAELPRTPCTASEQSTE